MKRLVWAVLYLACSQIIAQQTNILFIYADDMSYRTVGAHDGSHDWVQTPNLDGLAEDGVRFKHAYIGAKCRAARGLALTGGFQYNVDESSEYWATNFKNKGYYTGMIGKWHWGQVRHGTAWNWSRVWEHHIAGNGGYYEDQPVRVDGGEKVTVPYSTDAYADWAVEFIEDRAQDKKPWYLWLAFAAVHGPYTPAPRHVGNYAGKEVKIPEDIFSKENKPQYINDLDHWKPNGDGVPTGSKGTIHAISQQYNEAVIAIDEAVGKVRAALESSGQAENTLIVFTSDQGYSWGQHGWTGKMHPHASAIRSPFIAYQPGKVHGNRVVSAPINVQDVIKTFHSFADIEPTVTLDGRDFTDIFLGNADALEEEVMLMSFTGNVDGDGVKGSLQAGSLEDFAFSNSVGGAIYWNMVIKGNLKYIRYIQDNYIEEMYHIEDDPDELTNLAADPKYQSNLFEMRETLDVTLEANRADFVDLLPEPVMMYDPVLTKPQSESFKKQNIRYHSSTNSFSINNPENKHMKVTVYSSKGATLVHKSSSGDISLPLGAVNAGAYFLSVKVDGKGAFYGKFSNKTGTIFWSEI